MFAKFPQDLPLIAVNNAKTQVLETALWEEASGQPHQLLQ